MDFYLKEKVGQPFIRKRNRPLWKVMEQKTSTYMESMTVNQKVFFSK